MKKLKKEKSRRTSSVSPIGDCQGNIVGASTTGRDRTALRKLEEKLRVHASQMETLYSLGQEMGKTVALDQVIQVALDRVVSASGFDIAVIHLLGKPSTPRVYAACGTSRSSTEPIQLLDRLGDEFARKMLACEEPWLVEDAAALPELEMLSAVGGIKAWVVLPLSTGEQRRGTLTLMSPRVQMFGPEERQFLQILGQQIALAIANAELYGTTLEVNVRLQQEIEERNRAEKTLADFTAMVVHDLRSPLSNVVSIAESLQYGLFGPVNEQQHKWLWKIQANCKSLIEHVSDFLDLSKIEAGHIELVKKPIDLGALIHEILVEHSIRADKRQISLRAQIERELPTIWADPRRFNQVLSNLLSNALKFSDNGGEIEVGADSAGGNEVRVWVKDNGIGIDSDKIDQIFEKYHQVSSGRNSGHKGTGLGLVICKKIVEAQGGRIWVESQKGKGATFFFSLPLNPPATEAS